MATSQSNDAVSIIDQWVEQINKHNVDEACALYSANAILIPSMSNQLKKTAGEIREYISYLLSKDNFKVEILDRTGQELEDIKVKTGIYIFSWTVKGKPHKTSARFTFVIHNGKIIQHHSSVTPQ